MKRLIGGGGKALFAKLGGLTAALAAVLCLTGGTVLAQPANDNFANAAVLTGLSGFISGDNTYATLETCETNALITLEPLYNPDPITNSVWYAWTAPGNGSVEFDNNGSTNELVLSVWTTPAGLCSSSLTNMVSDDDGQGTYSEISFNVVAGTTYYISVASYDSGVSPFNNAGPFVLNWNATIPTLTSGAFGFTATSYQVSQADSGGTDGNDGTTVGSSIEGARLTVTRPGPAFGRCEVSYGMVAGSLTNFFTTNYFGTNVLTVYSNATSGDVSYTYSFFTNTYSLSDYQSFLNGVYLNDYVTNATTNSAFLYLDGVTNFSISLTNGVVDLLPILANLTTTNTNAAGIFVTNIFGYVKEGTQPSGGSGVLGSDGLTYTNQGVVYTNIAVAYTNSVTTNYYGTNIMVMYASGGGYTNNYTNLSVGTYFYTNSIFTNYQFNIGVSLNQSVTNWAPIPTPWYLPVITNSTVVVATAGGVDSTNLFGYLVTPTPGFYEGATNGGNGWTYTNGGVVYYSFQVTYTNFVTTNYYGTNITQTYYSAGGQYSTNYGFTNVAVGNCYYTNVIYTNGPLKIAVSQTITNWVSDTDYLVENVTNALIRNYSITPITSVLPIPTNVVNRTFNNTTTFISVDSSNDVTTITTNVYQNFVTSTQVINSAHGITLANGTLVFDDYQMSADIVVPVSQNNIAPYGDTYFTVSLTNVVLDPLEDSGSIIPPTLSAANSMATVYCLSPQYDPGAPGIFNIERSAFRAMRNVDGINPGGTVIISVDRLGGNPQDSVSVQYSTDPGAGLYGGFSPPLTFTGGYSPADSFPLQAESDYATPGSDYTSTSGTLTWGALDYASKQIKIPVFNNGAVEFNGDIFVQLYNPLPYPSGSDPGMMLGQVNNATITLIFDNSPTTLGGAYPGQQPAGAVDRSWNKDGANDSTPPFLNYPGTTPGVGGTVYAVAEQPNGDAIIAGSFVSFDSTPYNRIVRTLPNGYQDPTFLVSPNSGANNSIYAVALYPTTSTNYGKIIIGGNFTSFNGYNRHYVARLNSDGSVDNSFNPGVGANGTVWSLALLSNDQLMIAGSFSTYNGTNIMRVARLNQDGSLDTTFNPGVGPDAVVNSVAVDAVGRTVIGGAFDTVAGVASGGVARLNTNGVLDTTFAPGIGTYNPASDTTDPVYAVAVQPNGQVLIGGAFTYLDLVTNRGIARLNTDGTLDLTFQTGTGTYNAVTKVSDTIYCIQLQPDGNILISGDFTTFNQTRRIGLARLFSNGSLDTSFMDSAYNQFAGVPNRYFNPNAVATDSAYLEYNTRNVIYTLALETSSNILIGGSFTRVGGGSTRSDIHPRSNVARVIGASTPGPGNIEFSYGSYTVNNSDGSLYVSLVRTNGNLGIIGAAFNTGTAAPGAGVATANDYFVAPTYDEPTYNTAWSANAWTYDTGSYGPNYGPILGAGAGNPNPDVYVDVFNPGNISGNLSAYFTLSNPSGFFALGGENIPLGAALGAQAYSPLTIIDSNIKPGVLGFSSPVYTVLENGSSAAITVTRTNGSANSLTVFYSTSSGTATNGIDYTGVTNQLAFAIGQTNATFSVATHGHYTSIQPDKTVNLHLFTPSGGATLALTNAVLTLINPNYLPGQLNFSLTNYTVNENAGSAVVTVNRLGGSTGTLTVTMLTQDNTAINGTNYVGVTNVLSWNNGDATSRNVTIKVLQDGVVTPNLTAYLELTNSYVNGTNNPGPLLFGGTNATLTINNVDSAGTFQFSSPVYSVKKYGGFALIPVERTGGSVGTVSVNFTTADDSAVAGVNYTATNGVLTFTNGQVSEFINVPITGGATNGLNDLFVQLSNPTGFGVLGANSNATLYIIDSDSVNETPGSVDTTYNAFDFNNNVYAMALETNNQLVVGGDFTMVDGVTRNRIARLNSDGSLDPGFSLPSFTMGANNSVRALAIQTDGRILVAGLFTNFNSVANGHIARLNTDGTLDSLFNPGSGADDAIYAVSQTSVSGANKVVVGGGFQTINGVTFNGVGQLNDDGTPDTTFNPGGLGANAAVYALAVETNGQIIIGGDFTAVNGLTNFNHIARLNADGSSDTNFNVLGSGASDSVRAIAIQLDGKILIGGLFTNVNGVVYNHIARLNANGTLDASFSPGLGANDAVLSIGVQTDGRIVLGGEFTLCSGVTRNRVTRLNPDGSVDPTINFGTGANSLISAIAIQEDTIAGYPTNVPDEKIIIGGGFTMYNGLTNDYLARIYAGSIGGSGAFQFTLGNYSTDETFTNVTITVIRTGGTGGTNSDGTGDVYVPFATTNNSGTPTPYAVAGINYSTVITNLDFPEGEIQQTITVPVMDDGVVTPNLYVGLSLLGSGTDVLPPSEVGNQVTAQLEIINDDSTIGLSSATYSVPKNIINGVAPINVIRYGGTNGTSTVVFYTTTNGTATPATDYTPVYQTVTFAPGVSNVVVTIPVTDNNIYEPNQTVAMVITNVTGSTFAPNDITNAVLTIINTVNAPGEFSFSSPNYNITEGGGVGYTNAYITVNRNYGTYGSISVSFATQQGTALPGSKYITTNGVLNFADGELSKTFQVQVVNTATAEGPETFSVLLSNPTGGASLTAPTNATVTILNTNTGLAFALATNYVTEPYGLQVRSVALNVNRFNNTNGTTTVQYATADGTAVAGVNYTANSGTLTFNPGESIKPITVSMLYDSQVTGDLTFSASLFNPSTGAQLTSPTNTVVVVHDADNGISFAQGQLSVFNTSGYALVNVICSNPSAEPASVQYSTGGGTAVAGLDYTAESGTLTFSGGVTNLSFYVPILINNQVHTNRVFNITLSAPAAPGELVAPSTETVTIVNTNTPNGLSFSTPLVISGDWGQTNSDNKYGAYESGDPAVAGVFSQHIVWFQWTPTNSGVASVDTIGSVDDTLGVTNLDTVLGVYTGSSLAGLNQLAANDDLYPQSQRNEIGQWYYAIPPTVSDPTNFNGTGIAYAGPAEEIYQQPFWGPSKVTFNAVAGTTYYIAVDTKMTPITTSLYNSQYNYNYNSTNIFSGFGFSETPATGLISLNWALHPSGVFRFATEDSDLTGLNYSNGTPVLLHEVSETEATRRPTGNLNASQFSTTEHINYTYDVPGALVSVTRVAGSSGRVQVGYTVTSITNAPNFLAINYPGYTPAYLANGDIAAQPGTDFTPVTGLLTFDDNEMSKTIFIPITDAGAGGVPELNRDFLLVLTNAALDPNESIDVQPPRLDPTYSQMVVRILGCNTDPKEAKLGTVITTTYNPTLGTFTTVTNAAWDINATNAIFNFQKAHYRVTRDVTNYWNGVPITVYVNRMGTNNAASPTVYWEVNNYYLSSGTPEQNNEFPLQGSSDYATPAPAPAIVGGIEGMVPDFSFTGGGSSGSLSWGSKDFNPKPITFTIYDNGLQQFNEDFLITLYEVDSGGAVIPCGMVNQTTVTILSADNHPPAGSVDENYNCDFSYNMVIPFPTVPPQMSHPGTDGEVYGVAVQPNNKTIMVGDFASYDQTARNYIARANTDGSLDTTFNPGSGANSSITCIALTPAGESVIGGNFTAYNGSYCSHIALVNSFGKLDTTFATGAGFNGPVNAVLLQPNGQILVGGNFTAYNGNPENYLARLNANGSLDTTFNVGTNLNAAVYALGLQSSGSVIVGGDFTMVNGVVGQDHIARLTSTGAFDPTFDPGTGVNAGVFAVAVQPNDEVVIGGEFTQVNGQSKNSITRLTANGYLDTSFDSGTGFDGPVYSLLVDTNDIYSTTGDVNSTNLQNVVVTTDITIYAGGEFTMYNGTRRLGFSRLNHDGTLDTTFLDTAYNQFAGLPRELYADPLGTVLACGIQSDGNVMIGGSFERVGGGQNDDWDVRPDNVDVNDASLFSTLQTPDVRGRVGVRNRSNVARLIGGATPGPGNVGLLSPTYSIDKSQSPMFVSLLRTNGYLGVAGVNFIVNPGLAQSGLDYSYQANAPLYGNAWEYEGPTRMQSDGLFGTNGFVEDPFGGFWSSGTGNDLGQVEVTILDRTNSLSNLTAQYQVANPASDQFYLGGVDIPLGVALGNTTAALTLIDNHQQSGTFGFASPSYTANGTNALVAVNRTNGTYGVVSLTYATTTNNSTALANSDYVPTIGTMTFQSSDTSHSFTVRVLNTNYNTSVEKDVNLLLYNLNPPYNGLASLGQTNAVLRIINPNFQGFLTLTTNLYVGNLSSGTISFTVSRTVGSLGTLSLHYATTNGTAISGVDYIGATNTLSWSSGDVSSRTVTIPLINSGVIGANKQFGLALSSPTLNGSSAPALFATNSVTSAVMIINNDNSYGSFQFSAPTYVVDEKSGSTLITVMRNGTTNGAATVQFATANNVAVAGINYVATNGTLSFAPGQLAASFAVAVTDDGVVDPPPASFFFNVALSNPGAGTTLAALTNAVVEIVDGESYNWPPGSADTTFNPGTGMNGDVFSLALQSNGQIVAGGNFTAVNGVPQNYLTRLDTDGALDSSGFLYGMAGADGPVYALADQSDDSLLVGGAFSSFNGVVLNNITRLLTDGSVDSSFNPGSGANGTVYALAETFVGGARKIYAAGAFNIMNGVASPYLARLNNDGTIDTTFNPGAGPNGTVYAVAVYPTNSAFAGDVVIGGGFTNFNGTTVSYVARLNVNGSLDTNFNANVTVGGIVRALAIQPDDRILIGGNFTNVDGSLMNNLARLNINGTLDTAFRTGLGVGINGTVNAIALQADTRIMVGGQFTTANGVNRNNITRLLPTGALDATINFGDGANGSVNAVVVQPGDQMSVLGGSFTAYDDVPAGYIVRIYGGSVLGSGQFDFTSSSYQVNENGVQALIGVRRTGGTSGTNFNGGGNVTVNFSTTNITAVAGVNYLAVNTNLTFATGQSVQWIPVSVMDDSNITASLTLGLNLSNPSPGTGLGNQQPATLTIVNVDSAVAFGSANYSVAKDVPTGVATIDVARLGGASGTASVNLLTTTNGTAIPGTDFTPTNLTVYFNAGVTDVVVQVPILNNPLPNGNQTVVFALTNVTGALQYAPSNAVLTIIDTVTAPGQLFFAATNYSTSSGSGTAYLTVVRTNGSSGPVAVGYTTVAGTATPGVDYTSVSGNINFNDGQTSQTIGVPILNNSVVEAPVNLTVLLSNPTGGATLISPTNALLTIVNTNAGVGFVYATNTAAETAAYAQVNVQRVGNTNGTTTVSYATTNGTALAGTNYQSTAGTLTFTPGETLVSVSVPLINNTNQTVPLYFMMGLSHPSTGTQLLVQSNTTVVITAASAGLSFTNANMSVLKSAGTALITVVCSNPSVEPVVAGTTNTPLEVNFATADGSAVAGQDYTATSGTLVFTNGIGTNTFSVPITYNGLVSTNKSFTVSLSNPTAPGVLTAPSTQTVTIVNTVAGLSFSSSTFTVQKTGVAANITVDRTFYTNSTVYVDYTATNGTAVNGINFTATNGVLIFTNGQTSQTFSVPITDTTVVQPDLTVALQLSGASGGSTLVAPSAAILTIHDNTGSYVIPVAEWLKTSTGPDFASGIVDTNTTNTVEFAFRDAGGTNVSNMIAVLLTTNGVTPMTATNGAVLATETNTYGPLAYNGHSVSEPYVFSVRGTNGQQISPTFRLYDGSRIIGTNAFSFTLGTVTATYANTNVIVINDTNAASPYPSIINVSGVGNTLVKSMVTFSNLWHTDPSDIEALVVTPSGTNTVVMANAGNGFAVTNISLTFSDSATNSLPQNAKLTTGTNKPTAFIPFQNFP